MTCQSCLPHDGAQHFPTCVPNASADVRIESEGPVEDLSLPGSSSRAFARLTNDTVLSQGRRTYFRRRARIGDQRASANSFAAISRGRQPEATVMKRIRYRPSVFSVFCLVGTIALVLTAIHAR